MGVGMPAVLKLQQYSAVLQDAFGVVLQDAFGAMPYHVGSSLKAKSGWRDVDIRVILDDDEFARLFGPQGMSPMNEKWAAFCLAFAVLGREMTGLPIDFQVQPRTEANDLFDGPRSALLVPRDVEMAT